MLANLITVHPVQHLLIAEPVGLHHHKFMLKQNQGLNLSSLYMLQNLTPLPNMPAEYYMTFEQIV